MNENNPGYIMRFRAKPGRREELIAQAVRGFEISPAVASWTVSADESDPDTIFVVEFFVSSEAAEAHAARTDDAFEEHRTLVLDLLSGAPERVAAIRPRAGAQPAWTPSSH